MDILFQKKRYLYLSEAEYYTEKFPPFVSHQATFLRTEAIFLHLLPARFRKQLHILRAGDLPALVRVVYAGHLIAVPQEEPAVIAVFVEIVVAVKAGEPLPAAEYIPSVDIPAETAVFVSQRAQLLPGGVGLSGGSEGTGVGKFRGGFLRLPDRTVFVRPLNEMADRHIFGAYFLGDDLKSGFFHVHSSTFFQNGWQRRLGSPAVSGLGRKVEHP